MKLPETFRLPSGSDYDDLIEGMQHDMEDEGSPRLFLGLYRHGRRNSHRYYLDILKPLTTQALSLEERDEHGLTVDREHKLANAVLAGMLIGDALVEGHYPLVFKNVYKSGEVENCYTRLAVNLAYMAEEEKLAFENAGGVRTAEGRKEGYFAMSRYMLAVMKTESVETLREWADEIIFQPEYQPNFVYGVGISLYQRWDFFGDQLIEQGLPLYAESHSSAMNTETE